MRIRANKKILIVTVILLTAVSSAIVFTGFSKGDSAEKAMETYKGKWEKQDFRAMYAMLASKTKEKVSEQDFVNRYAIIYSDIEAKNISIKLNKGNKIKDGSQEKFRIPFSLTMDTAGGKLKLSDYEAILVKDKVNNKNQWRIAWDEKLIFPVMGTEDTVGVKISTAKRGEIYDRNGEGLAINAPVVTIGIHPSKFMKNKDVNVVEMAKGLDVEPVIIENKLKAISNPEQFVPIVNILSTEKEKISAVMKLQGVIYQNSESRIYPGGEAFGALIGYVGEIRADELEKMKGQGYKVGGLIGRMGLESFYEKRLRGENGAELYISKQKDGKQVQKITLIKKEAKDGANVILTVDFNLQKKIYDEMKREAGACTAVNPKTGEIMALVSSPSYDSNVKTTYCTKAQKAQWDSFESSGKGVFTSRFKNTYAPGSTFKLITAAVGLSQGKIKPDAGVNIQGKEWQADKSWGGYKITRVTDVERPVNLRDAFVYSDNIYFARAALNIGKEEFIKGCSRFGIGEALPLSYPIAKSQVVNGSEFKNDISLADSGYGQGEVLMSPLHMALVYSAVVNGGNIMVPILEYANDKTSQKIWKEKAIDKENIKCLKENLTAVIEDPSGTGNQGKINGVGLAGKTGTAELKKSGSDKTAEENGWFVCMNTDNPKIVVTMVIENVKNKGGSHYVVPMVKKVMEEYMVPKGTQQHN